MPHQVIILSILFFLQDLLWLIFTGMNRDRIAEVYYIWSIGFYFNMVFIFTCVMAIFKLASIGLYYLYVSEFSKMDFRKRLLMSR